MRATKLCTTIAVRAQNFNDPTLIWRDLSLFYVADYDGKEPMNKEPRLHKAMDWFDIDNLPKPMMPVVQVGIQHYHHAKFYGEYIII